MKRFTSREAHKALEHSLHGGQALHVWNGSNVYKRPACFRAGKPWAHMLDQDLARLVKTALRLGVRRVVVHGKGTWKQHVDVCGRPLEKAIADCE